MMKVKKLLTKIIRNSIYCENGIVSSGSVSANTIKDVHITFNKEFDTTPNITANLDIGSGGSANLFNVMNVVVGNLTITGFDIRVGNSGTSAHTVDIRWGAVGKLGGVLSNIIFRITHLFERRCVA